MYEFVSNLIDLTAISDTLFLIAQNSFTVYFGRILTTIFSKSKMKHNYFYWLSDIICIIIVRNIFIL